MSELRLINLKNYRENTLTTNNRANFGKPHQLDHQMKGLMDDVYINGVKVAAWDIFSLGKICDHFVFLAKANLHLHMIDFTSYSGKVQLFSSNLSRGCRGTVQGICLFVPHIYSQWNFLSNCCNKKL